MSARAKGRRLEREVASTLGGKRTPLSGGTGGGDITLPTGSIFADWSWETKARKRIPVLISDALAQAEGDIRIGDRRRPAVVIREDRGRAIVCCYLEDWTAWAEALAETGHGARIRELGRELERVAAELRRLA